MLVLLPSDGELFLCAMFKAYPLPDLIRMSHAVTLTIDTMMCSKRTLMLAILTTFEVYVTSESLTLKRKKMSDLTLSLFVKLLPHLYDLLCVCAYLSTTLLSHRK